MITLDQVYKTPMYYIKDMIEEDCNSYLLFYYGPYFTMQNHDLLCIHKDSIKNPLLLYMTDLSHFIKVCSSEYTYKKAKEEIIHTINEARKRNDAYSPLVKTYGDKLLTNLMLYKKENGITSESAILNYSPITGYSPSFLRRAEVSSIQVQKDKEEQEKDRLRSHMIQLLKENPYEILLNAEKEVVTFTMNSRYSHYKYSTIIPTEENTSPPDIPKIIDRDEKDTIRIPASFLYYIYAYLYAKLECNEMEEYYELNQIYNKISKDGNQ